MSEYDIVEALQAIEKELMESMIKNMDRHRAEETKEGIQWSTWQAEQMKALERYKRKNQKKYKNRFKDINNEIAVLIREARDRGNMDQEIRILRAIKRGYRFPNMPQKMLDLLEEMDGKNFLQKAEALLKMFGSRGALQGTGEFFKLNDRKLEALIEATVRDMEKAETAILRKANDDYRKAIFNAQVYANTGAGTYEKAVDMATKDMLSRGLNCVVYANGARHTLADYADMAIRTASKRAYLQGEGEKRQEWGIATVIVNKRGNPCPKCLPFCGKVLIDDVWSGGSKDGIDPETGKRYPLMSKAIEYGLYHPRCKDIHTTYFPGISTADDTWTEAELEDIGQACRDEAQRQYAARQAEKYGRLAKYSLDPENRNQYKRKAAEWKEQAEDQEGEVDILTAHEDFISCLRGDKNPSVHKNRMALYAEVTDMIKDENLKAPFAYLPDSDVIKYNPKAPHAKDYDMDYVFAHEITHRMDELEYRSWENKRFVQAIETCSRKVYDQKEEIQEWFAPGGKYERSFAISDIISALSNSEIEVPVGHAPDYWTLDSRFKAMEIFADLSSIDVLALKETEPVLEELFEAYRGVIE